MWKIFGKWFGKRPASPPPPSAWAFSGTGNFTGITNPTGAGSPTGGGNLAGTGTPAGTANPTGTVNPAGTGTPTGTGTSVAPQQKGGMGGEMRSYFITLLVIALAILVSLVASRFLKPFFVSSSNAPNQDDTSVILDIGEIDARTSDLQRSIEIESQNQRQDDQVIISNLDRILDKLSNKNKGDNDRGNTGDDSTPSQLEGIIGQISALQRSIDINTAQDPAGFEEVRRKLDDLNSLIDHKLSEQKHNITINVPFKTPEPGVKTPDQDKPRNTIGLVNVNTERH